MKILVLGGTASSLINFRGPLLRSLLEDGFEVQTCAAPNRESVLERLREMGVGFTPVEVERTGMNPLRDVGYLLQLRRIMKRERPDCVLGYTVKPVVYGSLAARWCGVGNACSMITGLGYSFSESRTWRSRVARRLVSLLYRVALSHNRTVFFQNPDDRALFEQERILGERTRVVLVNGSGVDLQHFSEAPPVLDPVRFLLIARLIREKGIPEYHEAAKLVKAKVPEAAFTLVGPFHDNPGALSRETIERWCREGTIEYRGRLDDVRPEMARASVYVLPSYYREGQPRTVLEALAMGRPVITADSPGCRETVLDGENGFLVPPRDPQRLAEAMLRFVESRELITRMGRRSRELAERKYDVHQVDSAIRRELARAPDPPR